MLRAIVLLVSASAVLLAPSAWGDRANEYLVDNKRIHIPAPKGFKNVVDSPKVKDIAENTYPNSRVLAFFVQENVDFDKPGVTVPSFMVLTVLKNPQRREPISPTHFIKIRDGIRTLAARDKSQVIYDEPRSIATMKVIPNEPSPFLSIGATVLLPAMPVIVQIRSTYENENDKTLAIARIKNWIEDILIKNPWRQ